MLHINQLLINAYYCTNVNKSAVTVKCYLAFQLYAHYLRVKPLTISSCTTQSNSLV